MLANQVAYRVCWLHGLKNVPDLGSLPRRPTHGTGSELPDSAAKARVRGKQPSSIPCSQLKLPMHI